MGVRSAAFATCSIAVYLSDGPRLAPISARDFYACANKVGLVGRHGRNAGAQLCGSRLPAGACCERTSLSTSCGSGISWRARGVGWRRLAGLARPAGPTSKRPRQLKPLLGGQARWRAKSQRAGQMARQNCVRLRRAALVTSLPGCAWPSRVTGLTMVASKANCALCHIGNPFATVPPARSRQRSCRPGRRWGTHLS